MLHGVGRALLAVVLSLVSHLLHIQAHTEAFSCISCSDDASTSRVNLLQTQFTIQDTNGNLMPNDPKGNNLARSITNDSQILRSGYHSIFRHVNPANTADANRPQVFANMQTSGAKYQQEMCTKKYSNEALERMAGIFKGRNKSRVFIAGLLHNNEPILGNMVSVINDFIKRAGPDKTFISLLESGSTDLSALILEGFASELSAAGVPHAIITSASGADDLVKPSFIPGHNDTGLRIEFLAKLRNAVLDPLYQKQNTFEYFDAVVFTNDVLLCEGDIWRLLALEADMACAYDFNGGIFWDNWVYDGQRMSKECYPNPKYPKGCDDNTPLQVKSCWDGLVAINPSAFYEGLRFRAGTKHAHDCEASECALLCRDMMQLGYMKILADPTVQVAYQDEGYKYVREIKREAMFDDRKKYIPDESLNETSKETVLKCCPLDHAGQEYINWDECDKQPFSFKSPLPYNPVQEWAQFEVNWWSPSK